MSKNLRRADCRGEEGAEGRAREGRAMAGRQRGKRATADAECQARDTVGAGDAYHAGFLAAVDRGVVDLVDCMGLATRVAAALCETPGPVVSSEALQRYGLLPVPRGSVP